MSEPQAQVVSKRSEVEEGTRRKRTRKVPLALSETIACDDEAILRELCVVNGINYDKLPHGSGIETKKLEIFFFGCPRIPEGLDQFPSLHTLCIVNQCFSSISGLQQCSTLQELWICETQVKKIEGLHHCQRLVRLHLYSNLITKIEGLETLLRLEKLWLNGNSISSIEGLDQLWQLKDLNLSGNQLTTIGSSLSHLSQLETLNLSGNKISSLIELVHLSSLPKLNSLSLCHPMYSPNPVCCLCNYSTHILYHFPRLRWLDGRQVGSQDLQKLVQGLVLRKIQYYRMKTHNCQTLGNHNVKQLQEKLKSYLEDCHSKMRTLSRHLKFLKNGPPPADVDEEERVSKRLSIITSHVEKAREICSIACLAIEAETDQKRQFWMMELNSGGNVKLTSCDPFQPCFSSCSELVHSRFSVADVQHLGTSGLEVTEVVRVENRLLFNGFNDKLKSLLDKEPYLSMSSTQLYKKMVDYLFLVWQSDDDMVCDICQDGFSHISSPTTSSPSVSPSPIKSSSSPPIWLTNSVNIAEHLRLVTQQGLGKVQQGKLLLCKVFIGQSTEITAPNFPTKEEYPSADSVFRVHGPAGNTADSAFKVYGSGPTTDFYSKDWFIFDASLILPEYIIHFKYLSPHFPENPLENFISSHSLPGDEEIASLAPPTSLCPHLAMLDEPTLLRITGHSALSSIQEINICNNRLTRFRLASGLAQMTSLILSGNELAIAEDFSNLPNLELLDLSYNKLASLVGMKGLPKLKSLDISWNYLTSYQDDLSTLRRHCPSLEDLHTLHNPWNKPEDLKSYAVGRIRTLQTVDGCAVTPEEVSIATKKVMASHLTMATVWSHAHADVAPLPSLSVAPIAQTFCEHQHGLQITNPSPSPTEWCVKVTAICLVGLGLRKLAHLDQFPNLRWLSLANNALTSLEGMLQCTTLEELTLDNNLLCSIEGVAKLHSLVWLSLSCNQLMGLPSELWGLSKLRYFNVSHNALRTLQELKQLTSLMELYISDNLVSSLRELFSLKSLTCLIVLDMTFNPVVFVENYRPFIVFHLTALKALDGRPIEVGEVAAAKEKLGGQLTQDFVFQKYPSLPFQDMVKLDLPNCGLKQVDLSPVKAFSNLVSLNLENNSLTSFGGLVFLDQLKVLCLNHNRIENLVPHPDNYNVHSLQNLQVLHLAYNGISNLDNLHFDGMPSLQALFLQGNEISKVDGLGELQNLTELVLDRNKIKSLQEHSLSGLENLKELHLEENRLRDLSHFKPLSSLERLYLGLNRIQDYNQLEKLSHLHHLLELSIISNPVSRRLQHRVLLIYQHPVLETLDGVAVSAVERQAAEMVFGGEEENELCSNAVLPGLSGATPLRVMNVPFTRNQQRTRQTTESRTSNIHDNKKRRGK